VRKVNCIVKNCQETGIHFIDSTPTSMQKGSLNVHHSKNLNLHLLHSWSNYARVMLPQTAPTSSHFLASNNWMDRFNRQSSAYRNLSDEKSWVDETEGYEFWYNWWNRYIFQSTKQTLWPLVCKRTIPTERLPPVGEIYCQLLWTEGCHMVSAVDPPWSLISVF
jgi:hypothetical protein